jgi:hypothetical protein
LLGALAVANHVDWVASHEIVNQWVVQQEAQKIGAADVDNGDDVDHYEEGTTECEDEGQEAAEVPKNHALDASISRPPSPQAADDLAMVCKAI